jgi:predicted aspartyl protease
MKIEIANYEDIAVARAGHAETTEAEVKRISIDGVGDTGASRLVLPQSVVEELKLPVIGRTKARLADQSVIERDVVRDVWLKMLDRSGVFTAVVEPNRDDALVGAIVMEELDMVVDCVTGTCHPRDPELLITELD